MRGDKVMISKKESVLKSKIHNRFEIEVIDSRTGEIRQKAKAENVILNQAWPKIVCSGNYENTWSTYIHYGGQNGAPSSKDTHLFNFIGSVKTNVYSESYDYNTHVYTLTRKATIGENVSVGAMIKEIGVGNTGNSDSLCTHAVLTDMNGNQISIKKTGTDIIDFYATIFVHMDFPDNIIFTGNKGVGSGPYTDYYISLPHAVAGGARLRTDLNSGSCYPRIILSEGYAEYSGSIAITNRRFPIDYSSIVSDATNRRITYNFFGIPEMSIKNVKNIFWFGRSRTDLIQYNKTPDLIFEVTKPGWYTPNRIVNENIGTGDGISTDFQTKYKVYGNAVVKVNGSPTIASADTNFVNDTNLVKYLKMVKCMKFSDTQPVQGWWRHTMVGEPGNNAIFENTLYKTVGIQKATYVRRIINREIETSEDVIVYCSNDLINWEHFNKNIPKQYQNYRYWSFSSSATDVGTIYGLANYLKLTPNTLMPPADNIHFPSPPPSGSVITIDYDTDTIAIDENLLFNFSVILQFEEYTEVT